MLGQERPGPTDPENLVDFRGRKSDPKPPGGDSIANAPNGVALHEKVVASARQDTRNVAGPDGPNNFEQNRTDTEHERMFHRSLHPPLQVRQEQEFQRRQVQHETGERSTGLLIKPEP